MVVGGSVAAGDVGGAVPDVASAAEPSLSELQPLAAISSAAAHTAPIMDRRVLIVRLLSKPQKGCRKPYTSWSRDSCDPAPSNCAAPRQHNSRMCLECDGYSHEAAMQVLDLQIRAYSWALVQVIDDASSWCYTVGLVENFDHPEFVLMDVDPDLQSRLMREIVEGIATCGELSDQLLRTLGVRCVEVHQHHLRGALFGTWANRYGAFPQPGEMVQVLLPDAAYCDCHASSVRRLDLPGPIP